MKKYFTTLDIVNKQFVATVFESNTNLEVYKTKPYTAQSRAMKDINDFLTNKKSTQPSQPPQNFINTTIHKPVPGTITPKRCCGRG